MQDEGTISRVIAFRACSQSVMRATESLVEHANRLIRSYVWQQPWCILRRPVAPVAAVPDYEHASGP